MTEKSEHIDYYVNQLDKIFTMMRELTVIDVPVAQLKELKKKWADDEARLEKEISKYRKEHNEKPYDLIHERDYATEHKYYYDKILRSLVGKYRHLSQSVKVNEQWCRNEGIYTQVYAKVKKLPSYIACKRIYGW